VALTPRIDGTLVGQILLETTPHSFAISKNGELMMDNNADGLIERLAYEGTPTYQHGKAFATSDGTQFNDQVGSTVYDIQTIADGTQQLTMFKINGELTTPLAPGDTYLLADGALLTVHDIAKDSTINPDPTTVTYSIQN